MRTEKILYNLTGTKMDKKFSIWQPEYSLYAGRKALQLTKQKHVTKKELMKLLDKRCKKKFYATLRLSCVHTPTLEQ